MGTEHEDKNGDPVYIYDLESDAHVDEFQEASVAGLTMSVIRSVNDIIPGAMWFYCDDCDTKCEYGYTTDAIGEGGISYVNTTKLCEDCYITRLTEYEELI